MATSLPAMRGEFGSTEYYLTTMKAGELIEKVKIPKELVNWEDMTIEERFQREINYFRVRKHMAPYLAHDEDRFFGALIVDIYSDEGLVFEQLGEVRELAGLYRSAGTCFGFLHFTGGEVLVPLDGQHRLAALRFAITGKDDKQKDITGINGNLDVANDDVSVIFVRHDEKKARKIFNKVNRYAKPTSKAENLITSDDDIIAVITRQFGDDLIGERLINYKSNTLSKKSHQFTTLSTIYESNLRIIEFSFNRRVDTTFLPDSLTQDMYRREIFSVWEILLNGVQLFESALNDRGENGDDMRREIRANYLLGKPIAQQALVNAYLRLRDTERQDGQNLPENVILERINELDWRVGNPIWQRVLITGERVVTGKQAALFASRFIAYFCGENLQEIELNALNENYVSLFPTDECDMVRLPPPKWGF